MGVADERRVVLTGFGRMSLVERIAKRLPQPAPVATLKARVVSMRRIPAGEPVSYGAEWRASQETWVATVGIGYADGVPRGVAGRAAVVLGGRRVPLVGRVTMDMLMVDAGRARDAAPRSSRRAPGALAPPSTVFSPAPTQWRKTRRVPPTAKPCLVRRDRPRPLSKRSAARYRQASTVSMDKRQPLFSTSIS